MPSNSYAIARSLPSKGSWIIDTAVSKLMDRGVSPKRFGCLLYSQGSWPISPLDESTHLGPSLWSRSKVSAPWPDSTLKGGGPELNVCRSALVPLHHNLELQETSVGRFCISTIRQEIQVRRNTRIAMDGTDPVSHSRHPSRSQCHAIGAADAAHGLVVGVGFLLQQFWICLSIHHNHLIDGHPSFEA